MMPWTSFSECLRCVPQRPTNSSIPKSSWIFSFKRSFVMLYLVHITCMVLAIAHMLQCTVHLPKQPVQNVPTPMSPMTAMMTSQNQSSCTTLPVQLATSPLMLGQYHGLWLPVSTLMWRLMGPPHWGTSTSPLTQT